VPNKPFPACASQSVRDWWVSQKCNVNPAPMTAPGCGGYANNHEGVDDTCITQLANL
jgi:hypothetical protein